MARPMTTEQTRVLDCLRQYNHQTVLVICSMHDAKISPEARRTAVTRTNFSALRGLEARGFIKVEPMWRGARVTVNIVE